MTFRCQGITPPPKDWRMIKITYQADLNRWMKFLKSEQNESRGKDLYDYARDLSHKTGRHEHSLQHRY